MRLGFATFSMAFSVLTLEVVLIRVFDFILAPNLGYLLISSAMFCLGLAGVYEATKPSSTRMGANARIAYLPMLFGLAVCLVRPGLNWLPFDLHRIFQEPFLQLVSVLGMFILLGLPFFLAGLFFSRVFSLFPNRVAHLYCWDLVGAALGSFAFLAVFSSIGPSGVLIFVTAMAFLASASIVENRRSAIALVTLAFVFGGVPFVTSSASDDFLVHEAKGEHLAGGVKQAQRDGSIEFSVWDPVSRIDVLDGARGKEVAYDGGTQSTTVFPFDGDYRGLRDVALTSALSNYWNRGVFAAHYLLRDKKTKVLVIGAGAGQEVKAALMFGASRVDAVEMVQSVLGLSLGRFSSYNGGIFLDPRVNPVHGEGRAFVRASDQSYDIIQIYSNYTTSTIASGSGAADVSYLLTVEAFADYLRHLSSGGLLQINHPIYPRLVTTAARAWHGLGKSEFRKHVVVWQRDPERLSDIKPTFLVKMTPWRPEEIADLKAFFSAKGDEVVPWVVAEDPLHPEESFLPEKYFTGQDDIGQTSDADFRVYPATDDRPFFKFIRKGLGLVKPSQRRGLDSATAYWLNSQVKYAIPMDVVHLFSLAGLAVVIAIASVSVLLIRRNRSHTWPGRGCVIIYYSLLGLGFIMIEVVFIQKFMKIIGYPVFAFSVVIFTLLLSAGLGSLASAWFKRQRSVIKCWVPFASVIVYGVVLMLGFGRLGDLLMKSPMPVRLLTCFVVLMPLGFFLGMPFPLGIGAVEKHGRQAIAWAWGMNGLATVVGSLMAAVISMLFGFNVALACAFLCYAAAMFAFLGIVKQRGVVTC